MAKAKKRTKVTTVEETEGAADEAALDAEVSLEAPADPEGDAIAALFALDDSDGLRFRVHKEPSKPGERRAYCNDYTRDTLSLDVIRATFGGGPYRITVYNAENQYVSSKQVSIAELPKDAAPAAAPAVDVAAILAASGKNDSMALMLKMFESQSSMINALLSKPAPVAPAGPTAMELVSLIKALEPKKSDSDPIELLMRGLELGRTLGGGETDMLGLGMKALETLGPAIASGIEKQNGAAALPAPAPRIASNPQPAPAAPPKPERSPAEMDVIRKLNWLNRLTAQLCEHAAKERNPDTYAEVCLDNLPPFITVEEIHARMSAPDAIAQLAQLNPNVTAYAPWFEEFRQAVLSMIEEEGEPDADAGAPGGPMIPDEAGGLDS